MVNSPVVADEPGFQRRPASDVGRARHRGQVSQLAAHHLRAADRAEHRRLIHDHVQRERVLAGQHLLAGHLHLHPPLNLPGRGDQQPGTHHRPGVLLRLEQPRHEHRRVPAHRLSLSLQGDQRGVLRAERVGVGIPPAPLAALCPSDSSRPRCVPDTSYKSSSRRRSAGLGPVWPVSTREIFDGDHPSRPAASSPVRVAASRSRRSSAASCRARTDGGRLSATTAPLPAATPAPPILPDRHHESSQTKC